MARPWRVRDRATFAALRRDGARRRVGPLSVTYVRRPGDEATPPAVAFAVSRAVGSAVERNRLRRRLRAILAEVEVPPGAYLIGARPAAATLSHQELRALVEAGVS